VKVDLKGVHRVTTGGHTYYYAWRGGGPRLRGEPGSPEFIASYNEAWAEARTPDTGRFRSVVVSYKASADYKKLADSTKRNWGRWLDQIADYFGDLRVTQFDRPEKIRPVIRPLAQPMGRQATDGRLCDASAIAGAVPCC
jgi:hypothetical protein